MSENNGNGRSFGRVSPEVAMKMWPNLYTIGIEPALPPTSTPSPERRGNVMKAIQTGDLAVWIGMKQDGINSIVTTTPTRDKITGDGNLLIYSFVLTRKPLPDDLRWGMGKLKTYAKEAGFSKMIAFTNSTMVRELLGQVDARESFIIDMEV